MDKINEQQNASVSVAAKPATRTRKPRATSASNMAALKEAKLLPNASDMIQNNAQDQVSIQVKAEPNKKVSTQNKALSFFQGIRHVSVGAMLSFLSNLPQFFDPILFVVSNSPILMRAILHSFAPLLMAYYVASTSPLLHESLFSTDMMAMKVLGACSLYAMSAFTWMMGYLFFQAVGRGVNRQLKSFKAMGESQTQKA